MSKKITLEGIIGPICWDLSGNPTKMALFLKGEKQYPISNQLEGKEVLNMKGERVRITGKFYKYRSQKGLIVNKIKQLGF